jgi:hypothetical protein
MCKAHKCLVISAPPSPINDRFVSFREHTLLLSIRTGSGMCPSSGIISPSRETFLAAIFPTLNELSLLPSPPFFVASPNSPSQTVSLGSIVNGYRRLVKNKRRRQRCVAVAPYCRCVKWSREARRRALLLSLRTLLLPRRAEGHREEFLLEDDALNNSPPWAQMVVPDELLEECVQEPPDECVQGVQCAATARPPPVLVGELALAHSLR